MTAAVAIIALAAHALGFTADAVTTARLRARGVGEGSPWFRDARPEGFTLDGRPVYGVRRGRVAAFELLPVAGLVTSLLLGYTQAAWLACGFSAVLGVVHAWFGARHNARLLARTRIAPRGATPAGHPGGAAGHPTPTTPAGNLRRRP